MKRTPLRRNTPLKRGKPLKARFSNRARPNKGAVPAGIYEEVLARDGGCVARNLMPEVQCWGRIDPHHVLRRSQGGADHVDNLVSLCRAHHSAVHEQVARAKSLGLLRSRDASD